jgi:hypothetical protein
MALTSPATTEAGIGAHTAALDEAPQELAAC